MNKYEDSPLLKSTFKRPYYILSQGKFYIHPEATNADNVKYSYIRKPAKVSWGYVVVAGKAQYNATHSVNFQLHDAEESEVVYKILEMAGITLNKPGLVQVADQEDLKTIQQEKM